jgi:hypothetical protein
MTLKSTYCVLYAALLMNSLTAFGQNTAVTKTGAVADTLALKNPQAVSQVGTQSDKLRFEKDPLSQVGTQLIVDSKVKTPAEVLLQKTKGVGSSGGGTGCRGNFLATAHQVALWLEVNGSGLKPSAVSSKDFLSEIASPELAISLVPESEPLKYRSEDVTAIFNGKQIQVRCDRLNRENPPGLKRVVAHEIFRKMNLEGDDYNYTKQVLGPAWAAANIAYSLNKTVVVMKFPNDPTSIVKISTKSGETEFFGIRECPNTAITTTEGDTEIAWEECSVVGGNYYKTKDMVALEKDMNKKVDVAFREFGAGDEQGKALLVTGLTFVSGGLLIYASDASEVKGMKQLGQFIDRYIRFFNPQITYRQLMLTKGGVAVVAMVLGQFLVQRAFSTKENAGRQLDQNLEKTNVTLKTKSGYMPFGLTLINEFNGANGSAKNLKAIIIDTIKQLEQEQLVQSYGKP